MSNTLPKHFNVPFALHHGYFRCIRFLLQLRYDPNERDSQLRTPLIICAYIENDRWSVLLAQNLLEKGARIALEDHARRNALHHACASKRVSLVKLYLSCLDFDIDTQDCEGNTCLHYAALSGHSEIADLLMKSAEKIGIHLDQYVNREGCSAAALALKYGHIDCANQITHRDGDEFFVVPRPLSIYEILPSNGDIQKSLKKKKSSKTNPSTNSNQSTALSFSLLKIIFNENDGTYSSHLAGLCRQDQQKRFRELLNSASFDPTRSTLISETACSSTEALVNENHVRLSHSNKDQQNNLQNSTASFIQATSSRIQLTVKDIQQFKSLSNKSVNKNERKSKADVKNLKHDDFNFNHRFQSTRIPLSTREPSVTTTKLSSTTRSQSVLGKSTSTATSTSTASKPVNSSLSIKETKHRNSVYCKPEILFGIRPEQLFASEDHQPKIVENRTFINHNDPLSNLKRSVIQKNAHNWYDEYTPLTNLYTIQNSSNYRKAAVPPPPPPPPPIIHHNGHHEHSPTHEGAHQRRVSVSKPISHSKHSNLASLQLSHRHPAHRAPGKLSHA